MKPITLLVCFILTANLVFAEEFKVKNFKHDPADISARKYSRKNVNEDECALIRIRSDLNGVTFNPRRGVTGNVNDRE